MTEEAQAVPVSRRDTVVRWVSFVARVAVGVAIIIPGILKARNLTQSVAAVAAYKLPFPDWAVTAIGYAVPIVEIVVGAALIAGLFSRWMAAIVGLMMVAYIIAIASAWIRGLTIDCGCYTQGGLLLPGQRPKYLEDILRDVAILAGAVFVVLFPRSPLSLDAWITHQPEE